MELDIDILRAYAEAIQKDGEKLHSAVYQMKLKTEYGTPEFDFYNLLATQLISNTLFVRLLIDELERATAVKPKKKFFRRRK